MCHHVTIICPAELESFLCDDFSLKNFAIALLLVIILLLINHAIDH